MDDMECMKEDMVARLHELTDVDFERDSAKRENEFSSLRSQLSHFIERTGGRVLKTPVSRSA